MPPIPPLPELRFLPIPPPACPRYLGDRFSYMESGPPDAPPLLLLHGVGANSLHWRFQFAGLADRFRVIAWNAPGYLLTDNFRAESPVGSDYADAVIDFLRALGIARCDVLANSFGTRVAQCVAWFHPGVIGRMVLTGTAIGQRGMTEANRAAMIAARSAQVVAGGYGYGDRVAALVGSATPRERAALIRDVLRATNPSGYIRAARFLASDTYTPAFAARLTGPLLMIQGAEDRITPLDANARVLADALPHARLEVLPGVGHLPEAECPDVVNRLVRDFLSA